MNVNLTFEPLLSSLFLLLGDCLDLFFLFSLSKSINVECEMLFTSIWRDKIKDGYEATSYLTLIDQKRIYYLICSNKLINLRPSYSPENIRDRVIVAHYVIGPKIDHLWNNFTIEDNRKFLAIACEKFDLNFLKIYGENREDFLNQPYSVMEAIGLAVNCGKVDIFMYLVEKCPNYRPNEYLHNAYRLKFINIVEKMLQHPNINPNCIDDYDRPTYVLIEASKSGHTEIIKLLCEHPKTNCSLRNNSPIKKACKYGHVEITLILLNKIKVDSLLYYHLIKLSCNYVQPDILRILLEFGKKMNMPSLDESILYNVRQNLNKYLEIEKLLE